MEFSWDENKRSLNKSKHGIDFYDVIPVFFDDNAIVRVDDRENYAEERLQIIGISTLGILFVVYTEWDEDMARIISARKASKFERGLYLNGGF